MPDLTPGARLSRAPEVLFSPLADGEGVLLSMQAGLYFSLNRTGVVVWDALEREISLSELASLLTSKFKIAPDQALTDLKALLGQMITSGLVLVREDERSAGTARHTMPR
jgi:hypothetical protein